MEADCAAFRQDAPACRRREIKGGTQGKAALHIAGALAAPGLPEAGRRPRRGIRHQAAQGHRGGRVQARVLVIDQDVHMADVSPLGEGVGDGHTGPEKLLSGEA